MSRLFKPLIQLFDASGATASAGTITFFAQGSSTLQGTFQDAARTLANNNPLTVDGSGLSPPIYLQYLNYTVLAQDSDGVTLWQEDFDGRWLADGSDYTHSGTGAVARTVQSRLEDSLYAGDFGATGDGVTDDTATIQKGLDATSSGGTFIFNQGQTFHCNERLTISSPMTIEAYGATIDFSDTRSAGGFGQDAVTITSSDVHIRGGTWQETSPGTRDNTFGIVFLGTDNGVGNAPTFLENVSVKDAYVKDWLGVAVEFSMCRFFSFKNCLVKNIGRKGVETRSSNQGIISGNIIRDIHPQGVHGSLDLAYGFTATLSNGGNNTRRPVSHSIVISDNYIENVKTWEGIDTHGGFNITVTGNVVKNCRIGIAMVGYSGGAADVGISRTTVTGNTIYNNLSDFDNGRADLDRGIIIDGQAPTAGTLGFNITVSGNTLSFCGNSSASDERGAIEAEAIENITVTGNTLHESGSNGIVMFSCLNMNVSGNAINIINPNDTITFPANTVTFSGQPTAMDTLTLNGVVFTFIAGASVINSDTAVDVNIGGNLAATITGLKAIIETARDTGTAAIPLNGKLQLVNYAAASTTLTLTYQYPTRLLGTNWTVAKSSTVITLSGANLSIPSDDQGAGIMIDTLSGGNAPSGLISGNIINNSGASGIRGINQKTDTTVTYKDNVLTGKGILYDIKGSTFFTCDGIDAIWGNSITLDLPSIASGSTLDVHLPHPHTGGTVGLSLEPTTPGRFKEGLDITLQGNASGYTTMRLINDTAGVINIASTSFIYTSKLQNVSKGFGDATT